MNSKKSMIEVAFNTLSKHKNGLTFQDLFNKIIKECDITDEEKNTKLIRFYNNLTLDGRFCHSDKTDLWTLRHTVDSVVNVNDEENISMSEEEKQEEAEETKDDSEEDTTEESNENSEEN